MKSMTPPIPPKETPPSRRLASHGGVGDSLPEIREFEKTGVHHMNESPLETTLRRTKNISIAVENQSVATNALREDLREYVKRDLDEHAEIRGSIGEMAGHVGGLRVESAKMNGTLETFVKMVNEERAEKKEATVEIKQDSKATRDFRRHIFIGFIGILSGVIGALAHWAFR
jgi:hypothetical protein